MERGNRRLQFLITAAVSTTAINNGVIFSWTTPVIPKFHNHETGFFLTETELSWLVSVSSLGYIIGCLVSRFTADKYGRRANLLGSVIPLGIGLAFKIFTQKAWALCVGRFMCGAAAGMISSVSTMYLAEISDKEIRGTLILSYRFMFSFGCLLTMTVGAHVDYQTMNYAMVPLPIGYFVACWFIPETPYFLLKEGRVEAARRTLGKLTNTRDEKLKERLSQMRADVSKEMSRSGTIKELVTGRKYRKALIIVFGTKLAQIMSGLHAVQQYLGLIVEESKFEIKTSTALIIFGVVRFVVGVVSSQLVDKVGRRPLLIYSFFGAFVMLCSVGLFFSMNMHQTSNPFGFVPFVGIMLTIVIAVLGFESVAYAMPSELFPLNIKSVAMTSVFIFGGLLNFLSVKTYQQLKNLGGLGAVFWIYAASCLLGAVFSFIYVPETKCKSLRQIQIELQGDIYDEDSEKKQVPNYIDNQDVEESELTVLDKKEDVS